MPAKGKGKPKKNQHQLCKPLPPGEVLTDLQKKTWKVRQSIGSGGFGLIYSADKGSEDSVKDNAPYVIKIEPQGNGPLFCEISFYQRAARSDQIETWKKRTKVPYLGVPSYIAHGLHERNKEKLRFLVMPRFGSDLHNLWLKAGKKFKRETVAKIAIMMLDALHYMHEKEYVHADIKGANILCGHEDKNKLYLVDFGLAYRYTADNTHKKYEPDPRKAHNGTIEYTSTDAHKGANPSRRGDMEILGFFLVHLLCGRLPWEDKLSDCAYVRDAKINALDDVKKFVKDTCKNGNLSEIVEFLQCAVGLEYDEEPNYKKLQNIFKTALKSMSVSLSSPLDFSVADEDNEPPTPKKSRRAESAAKKVSTGNVTSPLQRKRTQRVVRSSEESTSSSPVSMKQQPSRKRQHQCKPSNLKKARQKLKSSTEEDSPVIKPTRNQAQRYRPITETTDEEDESIIDDSGDEFHPTSKSQNIIPGAPLGRIPKRNTRSSNFKEKVLSVTDIDQTVHSSKQRKVKKRPVVSSPEKSSSPFSTPESNDENINGDNYQAIPQKKDEIEKEKDLIASSSSNSRSSRYSMAPLHTSTVLKKHDQLTGQMSGKHPVFTRRRKVNVPKANAGTQTTPTLRKMQSRK